MSEPQKRWAVVLGSSSGFGEATAKRLAQDGYHIIGVHLDRQKTMPKVRDIVAEIEANGVEARFFNVNAADERKRREILDELEAMPGGKPRVHVLVHSLAFGTLGPFIPKEGERALTQAQMEMTMDVMAHTLVYWTQDLVARGLLERKGRVMAMTSSGGKAVIPNYGAVSAAKSAIESHVRQLAFELGHMDIGVNAILAGVTDTPALRKIPGNESMIESAKKKNPRDRLTKPEDVAHVIALMCREGAEWISGSVIHADGGEDAVTSF
ncbi:MAG: SDR family oxidoreductase [Ignavibacteriales bacterium]|nr:SDR family oxidoreductase [Ignavibacteriales bacterium]